MNLADKKCKACEDKNMKPFSSAEAADYAVQVPGWEVGEGGKKISRKFVFNNFVQAVDFISGPIADIAEEEGHHPDVHLTGYKNVLIELSTHSIGGLSENDFIVAAKINRLPIF